MLHACWCPPAPLSDSDPPACFGDVDLDVADSRSPIVWQASGLVDVHTYAREAHANANASAANAARANSADVNRKRALAAQSQSQSQSGLQLLEVQEEEERLRLAEGEVGCFGDDEAHCACCLSGQATGEGEGGAPAQAKRHAGLRAGLQSALASLGADVQRLLAENEALHSQLLRGSGNQKSPCVTSSGSEAQGHCPESRAQAQRQIQVHTATQHQRLSQPHQVQRARKLALEGEEQYEALTDLTRAFHSLCSPTRASISVPELQQMFANQEPSGSDQDPSASELQEAVAALNAFLGIRGGGAAEAGDAAAREIALDTFIAIMHPKPNFLQVAEPATLRTLRHIKDALVREDSLRKVAKATKTDTDDINRVPRLAGGASRAERLSRKLDPAVGALIVSNALLICVSTDVAPQAGAWRVIEGAFTLAFILELLLKLRVQGRRSFFCGPERYWNAFDTLVIAIALLDTVFSVLSTLESMENLAPLTMIRLLRFLRLTKLVRVLKLRVFHELTLMINGILAGARTLLWAIVFLGFLLAVLGVLIKQLVGSHGEPQILLRICDGMEPSASRDACLQSSEHLRNQREQLFGTVFRSVFTVFRCITDGCSSVDGTPLMPHFFNTYGFLIIFLYMVIILFVLFGLFNLIMAIFVENTLANSGQVEAKRHEVRHWEHLQTARRLQDVIVMFCIGECGQAPTPPRPSGSVAKRAYRWLQDVVSTSVRSGAEEDERHRESKAGGDTARLGNLSLNVSQSTFNKMLEREDVQAMLDDLDIALSYRHSLFEILDANNNGTLEVSELVQGLLKLKGPLNKGESVAALLAVRSMQKNIKSMQVLGLHQQHAIEQIAERVEAIAWAVHMQPGGRQTRRSFNSFASKPTAAPPRLDGRSKRSSSMSRAMTAVESEAVSGRQAQIPRAAPDAGRLSYLLS